MIVVFDTNIWLQHLYLRAPAGAAARFYISRKGAHVALPEVIRLEVELREESSCNRSFTLFARLADLLKELRSHVAIDHDALTAALLAKEFGSLEGLLQRNGFQLAERTKLEAELFLTEKPHTCSWNSRSDSDASTLAGAIAAMGSSLSEATASTTLRPASFLTWES